MRVDLLTKEYPPEIYGGAGVHVAELVKALRTDIDVTVRCFGAQRAEADTVAYGVPAELADANATLTTLGVDLQMAQDVQGADVVHSHTWYANGAGHIAKLLHGVPHVVTAHSLEPLRPWKAEQLGGGYRVSSWIEKTAFEAADAVIAVSGGMRADILRSYPALDESRVHVVYNGIDLDRWKPTTDDDVVRALGIDPDRPSVVFVGRITRQKGLPYLLRAAALLPPEVQLVLCAGAPDTPGILAEVTELVEALQRERSGVVWIDRLLPQHELSAVLTAGTVFVCPSVYEPLGIVNLEAMACGLPVVGTATGGIPEVVADGVTGRLVPINQLTDGTGTPTDPDIFVSDLARTLTEVLADPALAAQMGRAGRVRAEEMFSWGQIAASTREIYAALL
ncbi:MULTISPECIES: glycogen synthase [Cryobacterium]|uniref:D-inositol 3-phosphate glycosyltransferase n=1 Tax=Cryobacterium zongtaii TaxID=1259217 RepID=A0A2S3ZIH7_9MICO|nr:MULTISPECIES: glycogen synthase [Cryobacterium]ASD22163.1 glycogen synthase [Cryobacterium sp. LW097]POH65459.1 glycogen synthase [Cryobacterium zongtaii]POH67377.1 glycogen synthase [Cryobacterium zongtaii]TFC45157.1 glycogen synthase [Cryobacterium sp. TMN-39-2]TFC55679.1 glycogen synthase [Cryobacterium sp. TMB3-1-2]